MYLSLVHNQGSKDQKICVSIQWDSFGGRAYPKFHDFLPAMVELFGSMGWTFLFLTT